MRKHIVLSLLFVLCSVVMCGAAEAQCTVDTSGYGSYDSEVLDSTATHILATVGIDGSASMSGSCGDLTYVTHTPQINSSWGWYQGDGVCADCYVSGQSTFDSGALNNARSFPSPTILQFIVQPQVRWPLFHVLSTLKLLSRAS